MRIQVQRDPDLAMPQPLARMATYWAARHCDQETISRPRRGGYCATSMTVAGSTTRSITLAARCTDKKGPPTATLRSAALFGGAPPARQASPERFHDIGATARCRCRRHTASWSSCPPALQFHGRHATWTVNDCARSAISAGEMCCVLGEAVGRAPRASKKFKATAALIAKLAI